MTAGARRRDDDGVHPLAPLLVGHADHRGRGDGRVLGEHVLHLDRVHVLAAGDDHVLDPVGDVDEAVVVHVAAVAGVHPAAAQRLGGLLGPVPVAEHHVAAAAHDLADRAAGDLDVVGADDAHLGVRHGAAGRAAARRVLVVGGRQQRWRTGESSVMP